MIIIDAGNKLINEVRRVIYCLFSFLNMRSSKKPILITGSHRSGSTWVGQMLAAAPGVAYLQEPFNMNIELAVCPKPFQYWFQYIDEEDDSIYYSLINRLLHYKYPLIRNTTKLRSYSNAKQLIQEQKTFLINKVQNKRPLIKDPIAFFSAEWLYDNFDMNVLVLIRHPAAFCSSLKIKNWDFDFNHFLNQPLLMERFLKEFENEIRRFANSNPNVIDQAILLWNVIHHTIKLYKESHTDWLFIRHEDLSLDPVNQFRAIFAAFGLEFSGEVKSRVLESSGAHNPVEQQKGKELIRNSKENIHNWKTRLSQNEINRIKNKTAQISRSFYREEDWL